MEGNVTDGKLYGNGDCEERLTMVKECGLREWKKQTSNQRLMCRKVLTVKMESKVKEG